MPNAMHLIHTYPIFVNRVAPFFVGKDARELEPLSGSSTATPITTSTRGSHSGSA